MKLYVCVRICYSVLGSRTLRLTSFSHFTFYLTYLFPIHFSCSMSCSIGARAPGKATKAINAVWMHSKPFNAGREQSEQSISLKVSKWLELSERSERLERLEWMERWDVSEWRNRRYRWKYRNDWNYYKGRNVPNAEILWVVLQCFYMSESNVSKTISVA